MIAVKVGDEDMRDLTPADLVLDHLYLRAFAAIHQVIDAILCHHLAGRMPVECGYCRVIA
jgi:hypothetical protein